MILNRRDDFGNVFAIVCSATMEEGDFEKRYPGAQHYVKKSDNPTAKITRFINEHLEKLFKEETF